MTRLPMVVCSLTAAALLVFGACASEDEQVAPPPASGEETTSSAAPSTEPSESPATKPATKKATKKAGGATPVKVIDTDYRPVSVTIAVGSSVDWTQIGDQPHSVTASDGSFDSSPKCGPLESDMCLGEGDTFSHRFKEAGEFTYYCRVHGLPDGTGMFGTVVVE